MIEIIDWLNIEEVSKKMNCFFIGGGFTKRHRWSDYIDRFVQNKIHLEALREKIVENKFQFCGNVHQKYMIPLFSDGTVIFFTRRGWGDLMATIWSEEKDKNYSYMDFI